MSNFYGIIYSYIKKHHSYIEYYKKNPSFLLGCTLSVSLFSHLFRLGQDRTYSGELRIARKYYNSRGGRRNIIIISYAKIVLVLSIVRFKKKFMYLYNYQKKKIPTSNNWSKPQLST